MRIITEGRPLEKKPYDPVYCFLCSDCGCQFECNKSEMKFNENYNPLYRTQPYYSIECPTHGCGRVITKSL